MPDAVSSDPPSAWRIDKLKWAAQSFSGMGAAMEGGRWNPPEARVVYLSKHLSMAAMEKLVHLPKPLSGTVAFVKIPVWFGTVAVEKWDVDALPEDWWVKPVPISSQRLGAAWLREGRTAVLQVPSAIIFEESNFLLNPLHPDFSRIKIGNPEPFSFDPRLVEVQE